MFCFVLGVCCAPKVEGWTQVTFDQSQTQTGGTDFRLVWKHFWMILESADQSETCSFVSGDSTWVSRAKDCCFLDDDVESGERKAVSISSGHGIWLSRPLICKHDIFRLQCQVGSWDMVPLIAFYFYSILEAKMTFHVLDLKLWLTGRLYDIWKLLVVCHAKAGW